MRGACKLEDGTALEPGAVLVTGAAGFVGRYLMESLGMGEGDVAADLSDDFEAPPGVRRVRWRLPSPPPDALGEVRYIVHLAAMSSVSKSLGSVLTAWEANVMGTLSVLEYMASDCPDARLLLVSSSEVYGPSDAPLDEMSPTAPVNPYGATKAAAETAALQFSRTYGLDVVVARPFPHIGPGQSEGFAFPSFCRRIVRARRENTRLIRVGNLSPVRDYLYVTDVADAYRRILAGGRSGSVYNVCSGRGRSIGSMVRTLIDIAGLDAELEVDPELFRPVDNGFQVGDPSKISSMLDWRPGVDFDEGLERLFRWWEARA